MPSSAETLKTVNLLRTGGEELEEFMHKVGQKNGKIPILVHPFFAEDVTEDHPFPLFRKRPGYKLGRDKFIEACLKNAMPLIIFGQKSEYHLLPTRIRQASGVLYTVITEEDMPLPKAWDKLIATLRLARVKQIQVGGQYLFLFQVEPDSPIFQWRTPDELNAATGCVGILAKRLACENFAVSLSPISSPRCHISPASLVCELSSS